MTKGSTRSRIENISGMLELAGIDVPADELPELAFDYDRFATAFYELIAGFMSQDDPLAFPEGLDPD
jgi:hypothetical protein